MAQCLRSNIRALACACLLAMGHSAPASADVRKVVIKRDHFGIPHIYADDTYSLFYGYGYAVAEDRLYQMEILKRSAEGSVAEVLGPKYLETDKATRSNFDPASLRRQLATMSATDRKIFEGYAAGFNARVREVMADRTKLMPREFIDQGFEPSTWTAYDVSAIWVGAILNRFFSGNQELANLRLLDELKSAKGPDLGERIYRQLRWLDDPTAPTIQAGSPAPAVTANVIDREVRAASYLAPLSPATADAYKTLQVAQIGPIAATGMPTASNAWVIAPVRSASNHAVLQNGPQQGWFSPSIIYSVGLHGAGFNITGATPVALPAIFFGTNGRIAWGSTVGALDTNDLYQEHLDATDPHRYLFKGAYRPMTVRQELIHVRGEKDVPYTVYATVHGAVSGWDIAHHSAYALKRSWQGHEMETLLGWAHVGQAQDWAGFLKQASRVSASITWFYADTRGHIGYAGLGLLPERPASQQIQFPANGDGSMEWLGTHPFTDNPKQLDPSQGYLVSWNNKTMPGLEADGADYSHVDRVNELASQLQAKNRLSDADIWNVDRFGAQADLNARYFTAHIRDAVATLPANDPVRRASEIVWAWDGQLVPTKEGGYYQGAAPAIFRAWLPLMLARLLKADLPADIYDQFASTGYLTAYSPMSEKPGTGAKLLWLALEKGKNGSPFSYDFLHGQDPLAVIRETFGEAIDQLTSQQGPNMSSWHLAIIPMRFAVETPLGVPWAGADEAANVASYRNRGSVSFQVKLDPDAVSLCSAAAPGQSGFIDPTGKPAPHYRDQLPLFKDFACKHDPLSMADVDQSTERTETLDITGLP